MPRKRPNRLRGPVQARRLYLPPGVRLIRPKWEGEEQAEQARPEWVRKAENRKRLERRKRRKREQAVAA